MKKVYEAPNLEIELYQLDASIAGNCAPNGVITLGPEYENNPACTDFPEPNIDWGTWSARTSFYEDGTVCTCYYTAGGEGYFTS